MRQIVALPSIHGFAAPAAPVLCKEGKNLNALFVIITPILNLLNNLNLITLPIRINYTIK